MSRSETESERSQTHARAEQVRAKAAELGNEIKEGARETASELKEEAREASRDIVDRRIGAASSALGSVARAIRSAADELEGDSYSSLARYTRRAADEIESTSASIRDADFDEMMGRVERFARSRTAAFLGAAIAIGFVGVRFLKSSGSDEEERLSGRRARDDPDDDARFGRSTPYGGTPGQSHGTTETGAQGVTDPTSGGPTGGPPRPAESLTRQRTESES